MDTESKYVEDDSKDSDEFANEDMKSDNIDNEAVVDEARDVAELEGVLISLFKSADKTDSGVLGFEEFLSLMSKANLGLSEDQLYFLMTAADENADGSINYKEFMAVGLDVLQALNAKRSAQRMRQIQILHTEEEVVNQLLSEEFHGVLQSLMKAFTSADRGGTGSLPRGKVRECLQIRAARLKRAEINMLLAMLPSAPGGGKDGTHEGKMC